MTSLQWFQNLAGVSFPNPTGQCKQFDANTDAYCKAEGVAAVFLRRLSSAIADSEQVLDVIAAFAVFQNQNCTAITVLNVALLFDLISTVTHRAGLKYN
jgi:acyl transferase domain-containing protein